MPARPDSVAEASPGVESTAAASPRVEAILAGAAVAFSDNGFAATSMRQIARATGSSLGAIYYHFDSKESILRAIISGNFRRVHQSLEERLRGIDDPGEAFAALVLNHIEFFARHLDEMRVMAHELDTLTGEAGEEVAGLRRAYTKQARMILAGLRPDMDAEELRLALLCLFGMLNWTYRWYHTVDPGLPPAAIAGRMSGLFLDGFLTSRPESSS